VASRAAWLERSAYRAAPDLAEELSRLRRAKVFAVAWPVGGLVEPWDHAGRVQNRETAATCGWCKIRSRAFLARSLAARVTSTASAVAWMSCHSGPIPLLLGREIESG
jgi:hypothetical protein